MPPSAATTKALGLILRCNQQLFFTLSSNLSGILRNALKRDAVVSTARSYERVCGSDEAGNLEQRKTVYKDLTNKYYDLVKDFYEYGWGDSFHFAPRASNESFLESLVRHERNLAR